MRYLFIYSFSYSVGCLGEIGHSGGEGGQFLLFCGGGSIVGWIQLFSTEGLDGRRGASKLSTDML